jgi:hypothetical protein
VQGFHHGLPESEERMEFVVVDAPERRRVRMDNSVFGVTQSLQQCRAGLHDFDLASLKDYTPIQQTVNVRQTSQL